MQTQDKPASQNTTQGKPASQKTKPTSPQASPSRPRRLVPALAGAAAVMVALVIAVATVGGTSGRDAAATGPAAVVVPGTEQWTDTGIDLSIGDGVLIEADGAINPRSDIPLHGPDGVPDRPDAREFNLEGLEEANHNSLIGRIGEAGAPFQVGSRLLFEADTQGRLFLGINDTGVGNNAGEFTATITVNR